MELIILGNRSKRKSFVGLKKHELKPLSRQPWENWLSWGHCSWVGIIENSIKKYVYQSIHTLFNNCWCWLLLAKVTNVWARCTEKNAEYHILVCLPTGKSTLGKCFQSFHLPWCIIFCHFTTTGLKRVSSASVDCIVFFLWLWKSSSS